MPVNRALSERLGFWQHIWVTADSNRIRPTQRAHRASASARPGRLQQRLDAELHYALRRRGLVVKKVLHDQHIVPRGTTARAEYYRLLRHYSFRLFMRDVIKHGQRFTPGDLQRYCSPASVRRYLQWLVDHKLARRVGARYQLVVATPSFGSTLEWFVAAVLQQEYGIPSTWNVRFDSTKVGGDYDVIGFAESTCVYIETKSSPPRNIDAGQVRAFFDRVETLRPQIAIFLNDTQLRMADKIVPLLAHELHKRAGSDELPLQRLQDELFVAADSLFIINAAPDLISNIGICLAHYFHRHGIHIDHHAAP